MSWQLERQNQYTDFDEYINAELMLAREGEGMAYSRVIKRSLGLDGNDVVGFNHNKMLDTRIYDIMFMDGTVQQLAANRIALSLETP